MKFSVGQVISNYEVLASIGSGASGEVYRARDLTLDRSVAIKVLPRGWRDDQDRAMRFAREAKSLAALSHPHVAQIYGVNELDGDDFLVLEFVEGEDLSARIARGPMPPDQAVDFCRQVAEGLGAAHDVGIIHRDLKPANVRITPDGIAKVLDFGLAKPLEFVSSSSGPHVETAKTQEGVLVGTPAYMSPEQIRGRRLDRRADIWAFGCVLYECLSGRPPFRADTLPDLITQILEQEPDLAALPAETPGPLLGLLARCLDKDPRTRLQDIGEARIRLERLPEAAASPASVGSRAEPARARRGSHALTAIVAALATWFVLGLLDRPVAPALLRNPLEGATFTQLTNFEGAESNAAISPDGESVAFLADRDGQLDAWFGQIGSDEFRNLTMGAVPLDSRWAVRGIGFRSDRALWLAGRPDRALQVVSLVTGTRRNMLSDRAVGAAWSPDGSKVAFHERDDGDPVSVAGPEGENPKLVRKEVPGLHQHHLAWSHDGAWIYFMHGRPEIGDTHIWRMRPNGEDAEQLTTEVREAAHPTPLDDRTVLFVGRELDGSGPWLWSLDVRTKTVRRVNIGPERYMSLDASDDRRRLVASVANPRAGLWSVPLREDISTEADVTRHPVPSTRAHVPRLRGDTLFYLSSRSGLDGLWAYAEGKSREVWNGRTAPLQAAPAISFDGSRVALVVLKEGRRTLRVLRTDGTDPHDVSGEIEIRGSAAWSPDGRTLAAGGTFRNTSGLFLFHLDDPQRPPTRLADGPAMDPVWSPRGDLIVYTGRHVTFWAPLLAVRPESREKVPLPMIKVMRFGERVRFLPDGSGFVYMKGLWGAHDFWLLDLDAGAEPRVLTKLESRGRMRTFDIAPDGHEIVFDRTKENSDVVLIELAR